jgi:hypothetical protein
MDPNIQLVLDQFAGLNRRLDEQEASFLSRFNELEGSLVDRNRAVDTRLLLLRLGDLEAAPADPQLSVVEGRIAALEVDRAGRDAHFDTRLAGLESSRINDVAAECVARVESLEGVARALSTNPSTVAEGVRRYVCKRRAPADLGGRVLICRTNRQPARCWAQRRIRGCDGLDP